MKNLNISDLKRFKRRTVGLELENPLLRSNGEPIDFKTIQKVWKSFVKEGWLPRIDPAINNVIDGLTKNFNGVGASIISDGGAGNFELAITPQDNLNVTKRIYKKIRAEIISIIKKHDLILAGFAIQPGHIKNMDNFRRRNAMYLAWNELGSSDIYAGETSAAISAEQVGIGIKLKEFVETTNEVMKITGLIVALTGNSPIHNWKILPYKEWRIICMGQLRFVGNDEGFEKLIGFPDRPFSSVADFFGYYWDSPYMALPLLRNEEWIIPDKKVNFLRFFRAKYIPGHNLKGEKIKIVPDKSDIEWAFIQMWPHAKPHLGLNLKKIKLSDFVKNFDNDTLEDYLDGKLSNCYIECRAAGAAPVGEELALPALMMGVINNIKELKKITKKYGWNEWKNLVFSAAVAGLDAKIKGKSIKPLLNDLYSCAMAGLKKRNLGEEKYLKDILKRIKSGENPADTALGKFKAGKSNFLKYIAYK